MYILLGPSDITRPIKTSKMAVQMMSFLQVKHSYNLTDRISTTKIYVKKKYIKILICTVYKSDAYHFKAKNYMSDAVGMLNEHRRFDSQLGYRFKYKSSWL